MPGAPVTLLDGGELSAWDHRGRTALLVCFLHGSCAECNGFRGALDELEEDLRLTRTRLVLAEPSERFLGSSEAPVILLVDRDGAAWSSHDARGHEFPSREELSTSLWHLATTCEQCEVPG